MDSPLIDIRETAERLGVSTTTVRRLVQSGDLPHAWLSERLLRFDRDLVDAFVRERSVGTGSS